MYSEEKVTTSIPSSTIYYRMYCTIKNSTCITNLIKINKIIGADLRSGFNQIAYFVPAYFIKIKSMLVCSLMYFQNEIIS